MSVHRLSQARSLTAPVSLQLWHTTVQKRRCAAAWHAGAQPANSVGKPSTPLSTCEHESDRVANCNAPGTAAQRADALGDRSATQTGRRRRGRRQQASASRDTGASNTRTRSGCVSRRFSGGGGGGGDFDSSSSGGDVDDSSSGGDGAGDVDDSSGGGDGTGDVDDSSGGGDGGGDLDDRGRPWWSCQRAQSCRQEQQSWPRSSSCSRSWSSLRRL
jgi:hypothetical protein